jgi:hypothetical protein
MQATQVPETQTGRPVVVQSELVEHPVGGAVPGSQSPLVHLSLGGQSALVLHASTPQQPERQSSPGHWESLVHCDLTLQAGPASAVEVQTPLKQMVSPTQSPLTWHLSLG